MEVGHRPSSTSMKNSSNLSLSIKKRIFERGANADGENDRHAPSKIPIQKSKSTDRWFPMPGRDLRQDRPPKMTRHRTFHGSPTVRRKKFSRSQSVGTECFSKTSEEAIRAEVKTGSSSTSARKRRFIRASLISAIPLLAYCLYAYFPWTFDRCWFYGSESQTSNFDFHQLKAELADRVFGQESALAAILDSLDVYFGAESAGDRPLVLSLHGGMGVGKTLVARVLERHFTIRAANVHWYFPGSEALDEWVVGRIVKCSTNVFILDDVDQNGRGTVTQLRDLLTAWSADDARLTPMVFVVTTNAGSRQINEVVVSELKRERLRREISPSRFSAPVEFLEIPNLKFVPFLPLDRDAVVLCAKQFLALYGNNFSDSLLDGLLSKDKFFPDDFPVLAKSGCKKVHVDL